MLRIEINRLLEYLLTGEDEDLVVQALPLQGDGRHLLARARAAIDVLAPGPVDESVRKRLSRLDKALVSRDRPGLAGRGAARGEDSPTSWFATMELRRPAKQDPAEFQAEDLLQPAIVAAARAGRRQVIRARGLVLERPTIRAAEGPPTTASRSVPLVELARVKESAMAFAYPGNASQVSIPAGATATIDLRHEARGGEDFLVVQVRGGDAGASPATVTWLPAVGEVIRSHTDGAGMATLPWPAVGTGVLRVDSRRTIEIPVHVTL